MSETKSTTNKRKTSGESAGNKKKKVNETGDVIQTATTSEPVVTNTSAADVVTTTTTTTTSTAMDTTPPVVVADVKPKKVRAKKAPADATVTAPPVTDSVVSLVVDSSSSVSVPVTTTTDTPVVDDTSTKPKKVRAKKDPSTKKQGGEVKQKQKRTRAPKEVKLAPTTDSVGDEKVEDENASPTDTNSKKNYGVNNKGFPYRTFRLVSIDDQVFPKDKTHCAVQKSRKTEEELRTSASKRNVILCPRNAASKIFTCYCSTLEQENFLGKKFKIVIMETTRCLHGKNKQFAYYAERHPNENVYEITKSDGVKQKIVSHYNNELHALKKNGDPIALKTSKNVDDAAAAIKSELSNAAAQVV